MQGSVKDCLKWLSEINSDITNIRVGWDELDVADPDYEFVSADARGTLLERIDTLVSDFPIVRKRVIACRRFECVDWSTGRFQFDWSPSSSIEPE
jgi:hypothetical protein